MMFSGVNLSQLSGPRQNPCALSEKQQFRMFGSQYLEERLSSEKHELFFGRSLATRQKAAKIPKPNAHWI